MQENLFGEVVKLPEVKMSGPTWEGEKKKTEQAGLQSHEGKFIAKREADLIEKDKADDLKYTKAYCMSMIKKELYLWDMRCWDKYKDQAEMMKWLNDIEKGEVVLYNCGHVQFLVERMLRKKQATKEEIIEAMLKNNNKQFSKRLVKCWEDANLCPKYKAQGHYGNGICDACNNNNNNNK